MPIEVELPDGAVAEFPDDTPHATIKSALAKYRAPQTNAAPAGLTPLAVVKPAVAAAPGEVPPSLQPRFATEGGWKTQPDIWRRDPAADTYEAQLEQTGVTAAQAQRAQRDADLRAEQLYPELPDSGLTYAGAKAHQAFARGWASMSETLNTAGGVMAEKVGRSWALNHSIGIPFQGALAKLADAGEYMQDTGREVRKVVKDISLVEQATPGSKVVSAVVGAAPSLVPSLATAPVAGLPILLAGMQTYGSVVGDAEEGYLRQGVEPSQAREKAQSVAALPALGTALLTFGFNRFGPGLEKWTEGMRSTGGRAAVKELGREFGFEFSEEGLDEFQQGVMARHTYDPARSWKRIVDDSLLAAVAGGTLAAGAKSLHLLDARLASMQESQQENKQFAAASAQFAADVANLASLPPRATGPERAQEYLPDVPPMAPATITGSNAQKGAAMPAEAGAIPAPVPPAEPVSAKPVTAKRLKPEKAVHLPLTLNVTRVENGEDVPVVAMQLPDGTEQVFRGEEATKLLDLRVAERVSDAVHQARNAAWKRGLVDAHDLQDQLAKKLAADEGERDWPDIIERETVAAIKKEKGSVAPAPATDLPALTPADVAKAPENGGAVKAKTPAKWKPLGVNSEGNPVFEDAAGIRSYTEQGVRVTEPIPLGPRGEVNLPDPQGRRPEFEPAPAKSPAPPASSPGSTGAGLDRVQLSRLPTAAVVERLRAAGVKTPRTDKEEASRRRARPPKSSEEQEGVMNRWRDAAFTDLDAHERRAASPPATGLPAPAPVPPAEPVAPVNANAAQSTPSGVVAAWVANKLAAGQSFAGKELFDQSDAAWSGTQAKGTYTPKDAYDAMELGVNLMLAAQPPDWARPVETVQRLKALVALLPTQTKRTAEMDEFQQFSTPPALAYVAAWVGNITGADAVLEPSAGVGGIALWAKAAGATTYVNELSPRRRALLEQMGFTQVFGENAEQLHNILPPEVKPTLVLMNPPFSSTAGRIKGERSTKNAEAHLLQALARLQPGGRLVAIVGEGMALDRPAFASFWRKIRKQYNLRGNVGISGKDYAKYGTTFDNQIVVIDKTGPTTGEPVTGKVEKFEDLIEKLKGIRHDRIIVSEPASAESSRRTAAQEGGRTAAGGEPAPAPTGDVGSGQRGGKTGPKVSGRAGGKLRQPANAPEPGKGDELPDAGGRRAGRGTGRAAPGAGPGAGSGAGVAGAPSPAGGDGGRVSYTPAHVGRAAGGVTVADDAKVYEGYTPSITIAGAQPHLDPLAESAAMASVPSPVPNYQVSLPASVVSDGLLSDAQTEAVVLAGHAHATLLPDGTRRGFFIGDGTGKTREIIGVLWDNWEQGRHKHVWISEKAELAADARGDMEGMGFPKSRLLELSKIKAGAPITDQEGVMFLSYDTLRSAEQNPEKGVKAQSRIDQLVNWLGPDFDGVIAFDEAHNMGNAIEMKGKRGKTKPSEKALVGVALQNRLPKARVLYVSATGATEVSNLSYAGRLGLWGQGTPFPNVRSFIQQISEGGVAAMELVARDMKAQGLYVARGLSFDGVTYGKLEHALTTEQRATYDELATAWQGVLANLEEALALTDGAKSSQARSAATAQFWGAHQRFFNQVITSMQMPTIIAAAQKDLAEGRAVVMQLVNTNEASTERQIRKKQAEGDTDLEDLDLTPRDALMQYVERSFPVNQFEEYQDENGNKAMRLVKDAAGNPVVNAEAAALRDQLLNKLGSIRVPDGPLEIILSAFGTENVAEVTGRKRRFVRKMNEETGRMEPFVEPRSKLKGMKEADQFMDDKRQVLVFSMAGGTGRSYHAARNVKNQRRRVHYLVQPGWRADKAVQGFGRTHRTNQAVPPHYILPTTNLSAQKRFISSIARRLDQLGALTKGQRQTGGGGFFEARDNLEGQYAESAMESTLVAILSNRLEGVSGADFMTQTGLGLLDPRTGQRSLENYPNMTQFLNRLLSLRVDTMNRVFAAFAERMDAIVQAAEKAGTLDVGLKTLRALNVRVVREQVVHTQAGTGATTTYHELELTQPTTLLQWATVQRLATKATRYWVNKRSKKIWTTDEVRQGRDDDGNVMNFAFASNVRGNLHQQNMDRVTETHDEVTPQQAAALWQQQIDETPKTYTEAVHMVTGLLLPVWDRFKGHPTVARTVTDDGRRLLGRTLHGDAVAQTLHLLGASGAEVALTPQQGYDNVLNDGWRLDLANQWTIRRALVNGEQRVEVAGPDYQNDAELTRLGLFSERIAYATRYFIPTDEKGPAVLEQLVASRPIVQAAPPPRRTDVSRKKGAVESAGEAAAARLRSGTAYGEVSFLGTGALASLIKDLAIVGAAKVARGLEKFADWSKDMTSHFGIRVKQFLADVWARVQNLQAAQAMNLTPEGVATMNRIEAIADGIDQPPAVKPVHDGKLDSFMLKVGRASRRLVYFGSESLLRSKREVDLQEAYMGLAIREQSDALLAQMTEAAFSARPGEFKLPKWMNTGAWAQRLKHFRKLALPIAAHLNATGRDAAGGYIFAPFDMRAGLMPAAEFKRAGHNVGDVIMVDNPLTGEMQELIIGAHIDAGDGRMGFQLTRHMTAAQQQEVYDHFRNEYPELAWVTDTYIDPDLADVRHNAHGVEVPVFNRFSLASKMAERNPTFTALDAYTPDVIVTRSLLGAVRGALGLKRGTRSPGRKYKTGRARESGEIRDLFSGFNIRSFQAMQEEQRAKFTAAVFAEAVPITGGVVPKGYVKLETGLDEIWNAIKRLRSITLPVDPATGKPVFPETESRLQDDGSPEWKAFFGEAARLRGKQRMLPQPLVDMLVRKYEAQREHGRLYRLGAWLVRQSTQLFLAHPKTYVANVLANDMFAVEAAYRYAMAGGLKLLAQPSNLTGRRNLRLAANILGGMALHRFKGLRELIHFADKTRYLRTVNEVLPDAVFADSTTLADVKVSYDDKPLDLLRRGEIGGAVLNAIQYGAIDVRAKQRLAFAYLKANAVTSARAAGLSGADVRAAVDAYMANPPETDRARAVAAANFEFLNYADSPEWLTRFSRNDYGRLVFPFPRFGYHFLAKQGHRLSALKLFLGKVPRGERAEALADLSAVALFGLGGLGVLTYGAVRVLFGDGDDDDDDVRQYVGTSAVKFIGDDGEVKSVPLERELITANRVNLSYFFRTLGIDGDDDTDFWLRVRQYPVISMAGAAILAQNDAKKFGAMEGVTTYMGAVMDLGTDFFSIGMALKVPVKLATDLRNADRNQPSAPFTDPYAARVPFTAYLTEQAMDSFVPGSRQADEVLYWLDPVARRRTASKELDYQPGVWTALRTSHVTGIMDRLFASLGGEETSLAPAGGVETTPLEPKGRLDDAARQRHEEGMAALAEGRANQFERRHVSATPGKPDTYRTHLAFVPERNRRPVPTVSLLSSLGGFNLRPVPREQYEKAINRE